LLTSAMFNAEATCVRLVAMAATVSANAVAFDESVTLPDMNTRMDATYVVARPWNATIGISTPSPAQRISSLKCRAMRCAASLSSVAILPLAGRRVEC
jgi:hypothetical protein